MPPLPRLFAVLSVLLVPWVSPKAAPAAAGPAATPPAEGAEAWLNLFDGKSLQGWRPYGKPTAGPAEIGAGWRVEDGILHKLPGVKGGDIITTRQFTDFELHWEWRLATGANNGIKYLVTEKRPGAPGLEYQMIDDAAPKWSKLAPRFLTGSFYEVLAPAADKPLRPPGEWNTSRLVVRGTHVEHHLNGRLILTYELGSSQVREAVAASKFKKYPDFGDKMPGHIMLTDHQDEAWFRVIRLRELPAR